MRPVFRLSSQRQKKGGGVTKVLNEYSSVTNELLLATILGTETD